MFQSGQERAQQTISKATPGYSQGERLLAGHFIAFIFGAIYNYPFGCNYGCDYNTSKLLVFYALLAYLMMRLSMIDRSWRKKHEE